MPLNLAAAAPATVLPAALASAYERTDSYEVRISEYPSGESQRDVAASSLRRTWSLARSLRPAAYAALLAFYAARKGSLEPFFFYDPFDTAPFGSHDATGVATTGRYTVRFAGSLTATFGAPGRPEGRFGLVEVA